MPPPPPPGQAQRSAQLIQSPPRRLHSKVPREASGRTLCKVPLIALHRSTGTAAAEPEPSPMLKSHEISINAVILHLMLRLLCSLNKLRVCVLTFSTILLLKGSGGMKTRLFLFSSHHKHLGSIHRVHPHTRFTGTAGRVHCVRIFTHFPCYEPACWSLNFMHFQTSVIRLVDRLT